MPLMRQLRMPWGRLPRRVAVILLTGGLWLVVAPSTHADTTTAFAGYAGASGARTAIVFPGASLVEQADAGAVVAQATLDSLGASRAFAALPYPGAAVLSAPGLVAGATGVAAPADNPTYVASDHPTEPETTAEAPGYSLRAESDAAASRGSAVAGERPTADGNTTHTSALSLVERRDDGTVVAEALSTTEGFTLGTLRIASVRSLAMARLSPGEPVETTSSLEVTGAFVNDIAVAIGPDGVTAASATVPLEAGDPVREALAAQGISIRYVSPAASDEGVVAPILEVTVDGGAIPGAEQATVTHTFGGVVAGLVGVTASGSPSVAEASPQPPPSREVPASPNLASPDRSAPLVPAPQELPLAVNAEPAPATDEEASMATGVRRRSELFDVSIFYLVLVGLGVAGTGVGQVLRLRGVRVRWTS